MSKATATPKAPRAKKSTDSSPAVTRSPAKAPKAVSTSTAKAALPRARKAAAPSPAEVKSPAKSPKPAARAKKADSAPLPDELRRRYVAEAAYYIAERRGFQGRRSEADWFEAEEQIRLQFSASGSKP